MLEYLPIVFMLAGGADCTLDAYAYAHTVASTGGLQSLTAAQERAVRPDTVSLKPPLRRWFEAVLVRSQSGCSTYSAPLFVRRLRRCNQIAHYDSRV